MAKKEEVLIFALNDVYVLDHLGRAAQRIRNVVEKRKPLTHLVTLAGDFIAPSFLSSIDKGVMFIDAMNKLGVTHACIGNHEFDLSVQVLLARIREATFKVLNSNINHLEGTVVTDIVKVHRPAGASLLIGMAGFCTENTKRLCLNVPHEVSITPISEIFTAVIDDLHKKVDFVIALTHQDQKDDERSVKESNVGLILGGHDHNVIHVTVDNAASKPVHIVKTGKDCENIGIITLTLGENGVETVDVEIEPVTDNILPEDKELRALAEQAKSIEEKVQTQLHWPYKLSAMDMQKSRTNFATFVLSQIRVQQGADCVLVPASHFKGKKNYPNGFNLRELHKQVRWGELVVCELPGKLLQEVFAFCGTQPKLYPQSDQETEFDQTSFELKKVAGEPFSKGRVYKTLLTSSLIRSDEAHPCPELLQYEAGHPQAVWYDAAHHGSSLVQTIIAALIVSDWRTLFQSLSFDDVDKNHDGVLDVNELAAIIPAVDVSVALMAVVDGDLSGDIDRNEWENGFNNKMVKGDAR